MATIKDVAKDAGVSPSTVSRVINNHDRISPETKKKVKESMDKIGYYPNVIAQNLVNQESRTLGLIMPYSTEEAFADPFYAEVLRGIGAIAQENNYSILLITCKDDEDDELNASLKAVRSKKVDGLLLLRSRRDDLLIEKLSELDISFVVLGRPKEKLGVHWVNNDNIKASQKIVEHLIDLDHEKVALVTGEKDYIVYQDRLKGYKKALIENNLDYNKDYVIRCEGDRDSSYRATLKLVEDNPELTAIFGADDVMAYGIIKALKKLGLDVPGDIAVVGFNNNPFSGLISPPLTTVDINTYQLGVTSTNRLIKLIQDKSVTGYKEIVETDIIIRESS